MNAEKYSHPTTAPAPAISATALNTAARQPRGVLSPTTIVRPAAAPIQTLRVSVQYRPQAKTGRATSNNNLTPRCNRGQNIIAAHSVSASTMPLATGFKYGPRPRPRNSGYAAEPM